MPSKKYMAGIPFTYRQIMGSVTVYFSKSKQCFIAQFRTANPAGGRALEYADKEADKKRYGSKSWIGVRMQNNREYLLHDTLGKG